MLIKCVCLLRQVLTFVQHEALLSAFGVADVHPAEAVLLWGTQLKHHADLWSWLVVRNPHAL